MTTTDYAQTILDVKKDVPSPTAVDEAAMYSAAQLISGSFTITLYGELWKNFLTWMASQSINSVNREPSDDECAALPDCSETFL